MKYKNIVILTGAGISEESGIKTFRSTDGLCENHRIEDVATPEAFYRNPELVHKFYNERRQQLQKPEILPNPAHLALKNLEEKSPDNFLLVTQNVDNLHDRAGSKNLLHMHGELLKIRCNSCSMVFDHHSDLDLVSKCSSCQSTGSLRPDIVWFGEMPKYLDIIFESLEECDLFICIGTSGIVQPAASFVMAVPKACHKIEVNLERTPISPYFDEHYFGKASVEVSRLVNRLIS